jgi:hypothetical protein
MQLPEPPKIAAVEVVAAQPTEADRAAIAHKGVTEPKAVYVVKVRLRPSLRSSMAWALYVNDELVSKYWEYADGIYSPSPTPVLHQAPGEAVALLAERHRLLRYRRETRAGPIVAEDKAIGLPLQADVLK